ncbi:MAG: F0F1 ATP synthase subunit alpha [Eubacteriales bacterium]|nr:F0F1 ATP synthase subunit alpha [Eubacteriales bacterium]
MGKYLDELITKKIEEIKKKDNTFAIGKVIAVKEYIVEVSGLDEACFMEKIIVSNNSTGYVCSIGRHSCKVAIVEQNDDIYVGDDAVASGELFKGLYSTDSVGHIIDIFGHDRVTGSSFDNIHEIEVEKKNVPLMDRTAVVRPLETGIAGIDLIYPIGKGQRQLILGDKKTGKTQLCLDTIVNQKDKKVLCIYVAIGKTKKNIVNLYDELSKKGAMEHTIIVAAFNDDPSPLLYLTPYVALSIAEEYMMFGMDVLVVIDDLKRHANIHREMSLLVGKAPGREAYPADIFYTHSRLLEKGCQHKNGGSITILPIVETKGGDATSYIPTNIISITDGQLILSASSFQKGQKPAIDYGLSVSRLGGAVQLPEMKKLGAVVRRELLSYLETRKVYELANEDEMSDELKSKLRKGKAILDDLNQYKYSPRAKEEIIETFTKDVNGLVN